MISIVIRNPESGGTSKLDSISIMQRSELRGRGDMYAALFPPIAENGDLLYSDFLVLSIY